MSRARGETDCEVAGKIPTTDSAEQGDWFRLESPSLPRRTARHRPMDVQKFLRAQRWLVALDDRSRTEVRAMAVSLPFP